MLTETTATAWPTGREAIEHHIQNVWSLQDYLAFLNHDIAPGWFGALTTDPAHWAEMGVTTAPQLADHLDGCHRRNVEKSEMAA